MGDRIRGQETSCQFIVNNVPLITVADFRSAEIEWQFDIQKEGYLGETTDRRDMIFRGIRGQVDFHFEQGDIVTVLVQAALDRATRRIPGTQINFKMVLPFSDGSKLRIAVPQVSFGGLPMKFSDRAAYGDFTFPFEAAGASLA